MIIIMTMIIKDNDNNISENDDGDVGGDDDYRLQ